MKLQPLFVFVIILISNFTVQAQNKTEKDIVFDNGDTVTVNYVDDPAILPHWLIRFNVLNGATFHDNFFLSALGLDFRFKFDYKKEIELNHLSKIDFLEPVFLDEEFTGAFTTLDTRVLYYHSIYKTEPKTTQKKTVVKQKFGARSSSNWTVKLPRTKINDIRLAGGVGLTSGPALFNMDLSEPIDGGPGDARILSDSSMMHGQIYGGFNISRSWSYLAMADGDYKYQMSELRLYGYLSLSPFTWYNVYEEIDNVPGNEGASLNKIALSELDNYNRNPFGYRLGFDWTRTVRGDYGPKGITFGMELGSIPTISSNKAVSQNIIERVHNGDSFFFRLKLGFALGGDPWKKYR